MGFGIVKRGFKKRPDREEREAGRALTDEELGSVYGGLHTYGIGEERSDEEGASHSGKPTRQNVDAGVLAAEMWAQHAMSHGSH